METSQNIYSKWKKFFNEFMVPEYRLLFAAKRKFIMQILELPATHHDLIHPSIGSFDARALLNLAMEIKYSRINKPPIYIYA